MFIHGAGTVEGLHALMWGVAEKQLKKLRKLSKKTEKAADKTKGSKGYKGSKSGCSCISGGECVCGDNW